MEFLKKYQARAAAAGVDQFGYYVPPFGYAGMQVLQQAVEGVKGLEPNNLEQFKDPRTEVVLWPDRLKSGSIIYPYTDAKH